MRRTLFAAGLGCALLLLCGCGGGKAKVKGRIVENGQAQKFKANQAHLEFIPLDADDKPQPGKAYTAGVNEDGSFEVLASGGEQIKLWDARTFAGRGELTNGFDAISLSISPDSRTLAAAGFDHDLHGITNRLGFQTASSEPSEPAIFGISGDLLAVCHAGLLIGRRKQDAPMELFQRPTVLDEPRGQPVQQRRVRRRFG